MFLYEEDKDKVLVYDFSPKKDKIKDYKKELITKMPKYKLFYLLTNRTRRMSELDYYYPLTKKLFDDSNEIIAALRSRSKYYPIERKENDLLTNYFINNGTLLINSSNETYFISQNGMNDLSNSYFDVEVIKLPVKLISLWMLEHNLFESVHYNETMQLFDFSQIKEFDKKDIDELIKYELMHKSTLQSHKNDVKVLKKIYNKK